jgi:arylsulfatase A-like enzyme/Tfp pilus assembly protein PilF
MNGSRILIGFCVLVFLCAAGLGAPAKAPPPEIFLITIDTLRADHVHCYGYSGVETPALDALAKEGIRFAEAFTPSPITNTSHASILTGLLPSSHGVTDFAVPLSATHPTMAELLQAKGYHTAAFIGAVILDSKALAPGFDRGFDFYDNFPEHSETKSRWGRVERRGMEVVQHAEKWLDEHAAGPHFLWVHLYDPHDPYEPPPPYSERYKDHLYDGEIAYADSALADFIAYLKKTGRYDASIIVVVGDHGEGLGEHHEDTHGIFLYDSTTHVPLILKLPGGIDAGATVAAQVRTVDIVPTLLALTGLPAPQKRDGESLTPYFEGRDGTNRPAFGETDYPLRFGWAPLRSVRSEGFKFIEAPRPELYELQADAGELSNKFEARDAHVKKARAMLAELRAAREPAEGAKEGAATGTASALNALGYVASGSGAAGLADPMSLPDPKDKIEEQNLLHAAMIASEDGRSADARELLKRTLALNPKSPVALRQLGELELQAGDYAQAAQHLKSAVEVRPGDATAWFYEGKALEKMQDLAGARNALETSLHLLPEQLPARLLLGQVYLSLKDPKAAEDQFEAASLVQPDSVDAQLGLANAQLAAGSFAEAAQLLESLAKAQPDNADVFDLLAKAYSALGKTARSQETEAKARRLRGEK